MHWLVCLLVTDIFHNQVLMIYHVKKKKLIWIGLAQYIRDKTTLSLKILMKMYAQNCFK